MADFVLQIDLKALGLSAYSVTTEEVVKALKNGIENRSYEQRQSLKLMCGNIRLLGISGDIITIGGALLSGDTNKAAEELFGYLGGLIGGAVGAVLLGAVVTPVGGAIIGTYVGGAEGKKIFAAMNKIEYPVNPEIPDNPNPNLWPPILNPNKEKSGWAGSKSIPDPIAIDLDGDGVEFVKNGTYFDYDNNKFAEKVTWLGKDDGWLARDVNGDGTINDGSELFGDSTKKKDGTLAKNGYDALAEFDDNKDGKIDSSDAIYSQLRVWQDANGNGISDSGELKTLAEVGIKQLNLNKTDINGTEQTNGESVRQQGSFVWNSGVIGQMNGYVVNRDVIDSKETELLPVPDDVKALPDIRGWGNVHSLQQAIVRDASG